MKKGEKTVNYPFVTGTGLIEEKIKENVRERK